MAAYEIRLAGCDDVTTFVMDLSAKEANLLKVAAEKSREASEYECQPRMTIVSAPPAPKEPAP